MKKHNQKITLDYLSKWWYSIEDGTQTYQGENITSISDLMENSWYYLHTSDSGSIKLNRYTLILTDKIVKVEW